MEQHTGVEITICGSITTVRLVQNPRLHSNAPLKQNGVSLRQILYKQTATVLASCFHRHSKSNGIDCHWAIKLGQETKLPQNSPNDDVRKSCVKSMPRRL